MSAERLTEQQRAAIECAGDTIVSASAGSGKTFVMIRKLVAAIENGVDLDSILAVTFTKKAAEQMKEKLRSAVIGAMDGADAEKRVRLKMQLSKISSSNISTIHSFCGKLLRTYFYAVGVDGTFDIISSDDALAREYRARTIDGLFERYYAEDNEHFKTLLRCYRKKRADTYLKNLILSAYDELRNNADYKRLLDSVNGLYTEEGFAAVCGELSALTGEKYKELKRAVEEFSGGFGCPRQEYAEILDDMVETLEKASHSGIFAPVLPLTAKRKPRDTTDEDKAAGAIFKEFKDDINDRYKSIRADICAEEIEKLRFFESGKTAIALAEVLKQFDAEYTAVKRDENKLDYGDLEHLTLELLSDKDVRREINEKFTCVFVDEYQDVNPVQEEILTRVSGGSTFLVGDVKQAIYGFRGSKSLFFAEKFERYKGGEGSALRLSNNFRSSDGVIDFVNCLFSDIMTERTCGFDYSRGSKMIRGGGYPEGHGSAQICVFGKDAEEEKQLDVYSVRDGAKEVKYSREGLAVLEIVKRELNSQHYDLKQGKFVDTQAGDICILSRKRNKTADIVRALTDAGYSVTGEQDSDILNKPEVKQMLDVLSYIDNAKQDVPLATALLSPLGGFTCDQLATVRIAFKSNYRKPFRDCCKEYAKNFDNALSRKLRAFYSRTENLRSLADVLTAAELVDKILELSGLEAAYSAGSGEKLRNVRRLGREGEGISVQALLAKIKGGYEIPCPAPSSADSIRVMTMHSSKGLEFPVVIITDICATFKGRDASDLPFDEKYFFAPKFHDAEKMLTHTTVLRGLVSEKSGREEQKNEYNLFYVACTRAMCRLYIMAKEIVPFNPLDVTDGTSYAKFFDMSKYPCAEAEPAPIKKKERIKIISAPDEELKSRIAERFARGYEYSASVDLPVKSSASAILRLTEEDSCFRVNKLFGGEGETGTERGIAYHRFLELCDFSLKDLPSIERELESFKASGKMTAESIALVKAENLAEILNMSVFDGVENSRVMREQEFLCRLPANTILPTSAEDGVLVQGAIDLLAETKDGYRIIDYKYSHKSDEQLKATYYRQLALYKKAVSVIAKVKESSISTVIVNIYSRRVIEL